MPRSATAPNPDRLATFPSGWWRFFPALDSLRKYSLSAARADLIAGLSVATVAVPQGMAYALVAGVPVEYGLYTAIVMAAIGAFFASSRELINGPTNAISIAVLSALATVTVTTDKVEAVILLTLLIGCIQVAIALFRIGDLTRYISHSVIVGFTVGASILLILDQTKNIIGTHYIAGTHEHFIMRFWGSIAEGGPVDMHTLWVGIGSIALLLFLRAAKHKVGWTRFPELLFTVILISLVAWYAGAADVAVVGTIPAKLPHFALPALNRWQISELAPSALAIATLGLLEAIAMSKSIAAKNGQRLDLNQICLSEGLANVGGGFFRCIPGSGSLTRSAINVQAGAVTQWAGIFSAGTVAVIVLLFAPYAQFIPKACLGGILLVTGVRMIDPKSLIYHLRASKFDAGIVLATAFSAVFISIEFCVLIGVFLSFMLAVPRAGRMLLTEFSITGGRKIAERMPEDPVCSRIVMFGLEGELFFGSAPTLEGHFRTIEARLQDNTRVLLLRLKRVRNPDAVCMHLIAQFADRMSERGVAVMICGVRDDLYEAMLRTDFDMHAHEVFREQKVRFDSTKMAVRRAYELLGSDVCDHCTHVAGQH
ncbi:MAG: SulP family inorganic anion transporter [Flavobacteriales bacterium]